MVHREAWSVGGCIRERGRERERLREGGGFAEIRKGEKEMA